MTEKIVAVISRQATLQTEFEAEGWTPRLAGEIRSSPTANCAASGGAFAGEQRGESEAITVNGHQWSRLHAIGVGVSGRCVAMCR
jgi:hypothetical protein